MSALADQFLPDALLASDGTSYLVANGKKNSAIKMGFKDYSAKSLEGYHSALVHFLAWSEMRGIETQDNERYKLQNILHYRTAPDNPYGSLEDYEKDMTDKQRPDLRSTNPHIIRVQIMVANAFLTFCVAQGLREKSFSPYLTSINDAYLDRHELLNRAQTLEVPEIEALAEFVRGQRSLRDRVATGLMVFGGLA